MKRILPLLNLLSHHVLVGTSLFGIAFGGPIDFELPGMVHGHLYAQDLSFFILHFERVTVHTVANAYSCEPMLKSVS